MLSAPATDRNVDVESNAALRRELERVRQQILKHLLQALSVGGDRTPEIWIDVNLERQLPGVRFMPERPRHHVEQVGKEHILGVDGDGTGFDLREVQNVANKVEEIGAGAMDGAGEFD